MATLYPSSITEHTGDYNQKSDIDIGISGLPPELFFTVYEKLSGLLDKPVDLVDFDKDSDFLRC
jgi:predicted nucleotidyltransferase